jgi:DNA modification methylase
MRRCKIGNQLLIHGDMRKWIKAQDDNTYGAIIADPPYDNDSLYLYKFLLKESGRVLIPGGNLVIILPQGKLPEIFSYPTPELTWRWLITMRQTTGNYPSLCNAMRTIRVQGKPIGWWTKKPWPEKDYRHLHDGFDSVQLKKSKRIHIWQQSESWAEYCLENFAMPNKPVLDPMVGAGTTLWVAEQLGISAVGIEIDEEMYLLAREQTRANLGYLEI